MKCDKPFIVAYNKLFRYLSGYGKKKEVEHFWKLFSDTIMGRFKYLLETEGIVGLTKYWSETLTQEGANFNISMTSYLGKAVLLHLDICECPSLKKLKDEKQDIYPNYCDHCKALYGKTLKKAGYEWFQKFSDKGCSIWIKV